MIKTVLVPTDFTIASLNILKNGINELDESAYEFNICLLYGEYINDSISDLLFYSPNKIIKKHLQPKFEEAISIIKNRFENKIKSIRFEVFHGLNQTAFNNKIDSNKIDIALIPKSYQLNLKKNGIDLLPYIKKSNVEIKEVDWEKNKFLNESDEINSVFN
jgi:hypothetical protein